MRQIGNNIFWVGAVDWDRRIFDSLVPLPHGTSYNAYLVRGSEKTALIDTVDPSAVNTLLSHLKGLKKIDYIVSNHSEQDHSGAIPQILEVYAEAMVVASPKAIPFLMNHLRVPEDRIISVNDGETLSLGDKTLEFLHAPWIHWPETMVTYLIEDKILFTCDLFGSHFATSDIFSGGDWQICQAAKRYYAEVMMPFRATIRKHLQRFDHYDINMIAPSHGPVHDKPERIVQAHRDWVSDRLCNVVILPYVSMHGSTQMMVDRLTDSLISKGISVRRFNLTVTDTGMLAIALVDAATIVIGSPTVLSGAHPLVVSAVFLANALRPKVKFTSIVGSYGWGGRMVDQIKSLMPNLKAEMLENVMVKGMPDDDSFIALDRLAASIATRHKGLDLLQ